MTQEIKALQEGDAAPDFTLPTNEEESIQLSSLKGKQVVLYFYPKDNTPGCTTEALDFTALNDEFKKINTQIIGISPDSVKKHCNFAEKHGLKVLLASDEEKSVINEYGVWVEKKNYGRTYMGVERSTFLVDSDGKLFKIWRRVRVKGHADAVLKEAKELNES